MHLQKIHLHFSAFLTINCILIIFQYAVPTSNRIILSQIDNIIYSTSMSSNHSLRNLSIQTIVLQNEELRKALIQSQQNQQIIDQLSSKLNLYKIKQMDLLNLNTALTQKINSQTILMNQRENSYTQEMQYVFTQHDKIIFNVEQELKNCRYQLQKLTERNRQVEEYAKIYQERQRQLSENYEMQLNRYKSKIADFESQLQSVQKNTEKEKIAFEKARTTWTSEQQLQNGEIIKLTNIIKKLENDNLMLIDYSKQLENNLIKIEQENKGTLITLREKLIQQQEEIHTYIHLNKGLENSNQIITKQLEDLKRLQAHLSTDNENLSMENEKIINLLTQSDKQIKYLREQITELEITINKNLEKCEIELQELRKEKLELLRSKNQAESYANAKVAELRELSSSANKLQALATKQEGHIKGLTSDLNDLQLLLTKEKQRSSELSIKIKEITDNSQALKQENERFQQINNKLKIQIDELSAQAMTLAKNAVNPKDINKQFIEQMNTMLIKFREEREQQSRYHILEKQKIKERYEYEIKQIQLDLLKKISLLEEQLLLSQKFQILAERNNNIYTYTSRKYDQ